MVNTSKGNYLAHSSKVVDEYSVSRTNMHGVRMRGRHFKSTPTRRPYSLPSEKSQRDDVSLTRLLKKGLFSNVEPSVADVHVPSAHPDERSSSKDIFVPTPSYTSATIEKVGQSGRSLPIRSSVCVGSSVVEPYR
ncbi:uncharacterized protein E5676_scaffold236G00690 [Cucumis melo var. makuwa]|uniref:Uncharacterized protein n=1 Tax=Cucumis melo var. makuwa TaxID=1194695 RepID=A0A5D3DV79_CUCMM|nr:uncharacterized protein E6C27_scaffold113G00020 [Cucumis melo var. makuwa]TYK27200.1 uncharacterized protein E5676_scaffold236G00690 [Cucumis melo var. makuwa]